MELFMNVAIVLFVVMAVIMYGAVCVLLVRDAFN